MVDPGIAQVVIKNLNHWYRKKAKPRGTLDHFYRGTRMNYTSSYRVVICFFSLIMLSGAYALYFVPGLFADKSPWIVLLIKIAWVGITVVSLLAPMQAFREFVIVNDEDVMKSDLFGRQKRFNWKEITSFHLKPDSNELVFQIADSKRKLTMNLAYDGWRDFLELAEKHLDPVLNFRLVYEVATLAVRRPVARPIKKSRWFMWFFRRGG
jgi:hypothetical protein